MSPERDDVFWFADVSDTPATDAFRWQPFLQTTGSCFPLPVWFDSKEACEAFIRSDIATAGFDLPDSEDFQAEER